MHETKNMRSRRISIALLLAFASAIAYAQSFPDKPVRMVVHIGPGSSMDIVARVLAQKLNEVSGQPVIIDNRGGAGGTLGMDVVAKAVPDGYTLLFGSSSVAIAASYYRKLPFDALRDLEPMIQISSRHNALVASPSSPANSVKDLIALAKARPGALGVEAEGGDATRFKTYFRNDLAKWRNVVKAAGVSDSP
jgi:tripartite-type tricarboxylate transporter receptor subunit TctC